MVDAAFYSAASEPEANLWGWRWNPLTGAVRATLPVPTRPIITIAGKMLHYQRAVGG